MNINDTVKQYVALKEELKFLNEREVELKKRLLASVEELGEEDSKGHLILDVEGTTLTKQRKVSNPLDMEIAKPLLEEKGLTKTQSLLRTQKGYLQKKKLNLCFLKRLLTLFW